MRAGRQYGSFMAIWLFHGNRALSWQYGYFMAIGLFPARAGRQEGSVMNESREAIGLFHGNPRGYF